MPAKSTKDRAKLAKRRGIAMTIRVSDLGIPTGRSAHAEKKSGMLIGDRGFSDRHVHPAAVPGMGRTLRGERLPLPSESGTTSSRRLTTPSGARSFRKDNTHK